MIEEKISICPFYQGCTARKQRINEIICNPTNPGNGEGCATYFETDFEENHKSYSTQR